MPISLLFILSALAVFRLSELVVIDKGPWHVFEKLRNFFPQDSGLDELVECMYCIGIWLSIFATLFVCFFHLVPWVYSPLWCFGVAGAAISIYRTLRPRT